MNLKVLFLVLTIFSTIGYFPVSATQEFSTSSLNDGLDGLDGFDEYPHLYRNTTDNGIYIRWNCTQNATHSSYLVLLDLMYFRVEIAVDITNIALWEQVGFNFLQGLPSVGSLNNESPVFMMSLLRNTSAIYFVYTSTANHSLAFSNHLFPCGTNNPNQGKISGGFPGDEANYTIVQWQETYSTYWDVAGINYVDRFNITEIRIAMYCQANIEVALKNGTVTGEHNYYFLVDFTDPITLSIIEQITDVLLTFLVGVFAVALTAGLAYIKGLVNFKDDDLLFKKN